MRGAETDPLWNAGNCRNRRLSSGSAIEQVAANTKGCLLQAYSMKFVSLFYADESAPHSGQSSADQHIKRMSAERLPVGTHLYSEAAKLTVVGGIEKSGQNDQETGDVEHFRCPFPLRTAHLDTTLVLLRFSSLVDDNRHNTVSQGAW
jgi:hypothetical protein